jgi:hypothetical protein
MGNMSLMEKLVSNYEDKPVIRALIQLIPSGIGAAIEAAVLTRVENIRAERAYAFFEELAKGSIELSPELLESEDFLHCYFATTKAALNTRRREKIRLFARLITASTVDDNFIDVDEYEEYLQILDELSYREFMILYKISEYEASHPYNEDKNDLERAEQFWDSLRNDFVNESKISEDEITSCLLRLARTGCYELFMGKYWDVRDGQGMVTPRFYRLKKYVVEKESEM